MALQTAWSGPSCFYILLKITLGLIKGIAEFGRIDPTAVGFSFDC